MEEDGCFQTDDSYLLRCASTYNWDALLEHCQTLSSRAELQQMALSCYARQMVATDQWGNTPLHVALFNNPPDDVVEALLDTAATSDSEGKPITTSRSKDGSTPLLIACGTGASLATINLLLNHPSDGPIGGEPAALMADSFGNTPLSELCTNYEIRRKSTTTREVSPPLDEIYTNGTEANSTTRQFAEFWAKTKAIITSAVSVACHSVGKEQKNHRICLRTDGAEAESARVANENGEKYERREIEYGDQNTASPKIRSGEWSILHGCASVSHTCPPPLMRLICRMDAEMIAVRDKDGLLPLHFAITSGTHAMPSSSLHLNTVRNRSRAIEILLDPYSDAARRSFPNNARSPLCHAISLGLTWHVEGNDGVPSETMNGPLMSLLRHAPEALHARDVVTGLYPFMLAATVSSYGGGYTSEGEHKDHSHLDTVYSLLRLYPQLIQVARSQGVP